MPILKVVFVDDEPLMLEGLRLMVDWEKLGYEICGEASDGEDALQLIRHFQPDLVITDIRMPVIDGLELISLVSASHPKTRFIILSGYADFEYARQAMAYGTFCYLTKPVADAELEQSVLAVADELRKEQAILAQCHSVHKDRQEELLCGFQVRPDLLADIGKTGRVPVIEDGCRYRCVLVHGSFMDEEAMHSCVIAKHKAIMEEITGAVRVKVIPFICGPEKHGYLLSTQKEDHPLGFPLVEQFIRQIGTCYPDTAYFSVSGEHMGNKDMKVAYQEALVAGWSSCEFNPPVIRYFQEQDLEQLAMAPAEIMKTLTQLIKEGRTDAAFSQTLRIFAAFEACMAPKVWVSAFLNNIKLNLLRETDRQDTRMEERDMKWFSSKDDLLPPPVLGQQIAQELIEAAEKIAFAPGSGGRPDRLAGEAADYIRTHYSEKLRLEDIANHLHVNAAYLGQRMKKQFGISFKEFFHAVRIEEAEKLLRRTDLNIFDIAMRVGYSDTERFTAKFKAFKGIPPSAYKKG